MLTFALALALQTPADSAPKAVWTQPELERVADEIRGQIEELRGMKFKAPVAVKLADKKTFIEYVKSRQEKNESPAKLARDETIAKLLGLIPPGMDYQAAILEVLEGQVGGFYDPSSNTFFLMETFTGGVAKIILAHELTHALDDQHFDIDGTLAKCGEDTDAAFAFMAVCEGSGMGLMREWMQAHASEISREDLIAAANLGADTLEKAPPLLWKPLFALYSSGESFLVRTSGINELGKAAKTTDVQTAFASPPRSSEQILHPKKYWMGTQRDEPLTVSIDTTKLPADWKLAGVDTLGELYLGLLTTPIPERAGVDPQAGMSIEYTNKASRGWGGDRVALLRRGEDAMLQLVTAWDTQEDADEFAVALGDPKKLTAIPVFAGAERSKDTGWVASTTATSAIVTREKTKDGQVPLVVVRVFSFAKADVEEAEIEKLLLPFSVETPEK